MIDENKKPVGLDNKLVAVEYDENLLNDLDESIRALVKDQVDPERVKKATNEELDRIPSKPISKGDSWDHTTKANLGGGQVLAIESRCTYEGELERGGKKLDRISLKVNKVEYTLEADSPLPLKLKSSELKPTDSKGDILFDRELGQVVESNSQVTIMGDMVFIINAMELPAKLNLKLESTTTQN